MKLFIILNDGTIIIRNTADITHMSMHDTIVILTYEALNKVECYRVDDISTMLILK